MIGAAAREHFAGLEGDWAYFDNAGGSFTLKRVIERTSDYMRTTPVQLGGSYPLSAQAAARQTEAVARLARLVNAADVQEIVLGSSSTALTWQVARAMQPTLRPGDEIVITSMDHEANRSPWLALAQAGVHVREWHIDADNFSLSLSQLDTLLGERTRLVCFSHCSNVIGQIEPVREIARRVHAAGAKVLVDGVAYAPHRRVDVQALDVDFYVCSLYKMFGPHLGLLYGRREALVELGNINHAWLPADALPYKLQPGGASYELVWGAAGIADYLEHDDVFASIAAYEAELAQPLLELLAAHPRVRLLGTASAAVDARVPIISFVSEKHASRDIVQQLEVQCLAVRHGNFNARRLLETLGVDVHDGVVRISLAHYNTAEELARLTRALEGML